MTWAGKWLIAAAAALPLVLAADSAGSFAMRSAQVGRALTARLEASFGRPIQVGGYEFSLWDGPRIEADSVTVGEQPIRAKADSVICGGASAGFRVAATAHAASGCWAAFRSPPSKPIAGRLYGDRVSS